MKRGLILINQISENPDSDELDVLAQAEAVEHAMQMLGYQVHKQFFDLNLNTTISAVHRLQPDVVFNLVESVGGRAELIHIAPALLESMGLPFTGSGTFPIYTTSDKIRTKEILHGCGIPTPAWFRPQEKTWLLPGKSYILKPVWEDGSVGITDKAVVRENDPEVVDFFAGRTDGNLFLEEYIHGREFNLSLLGGISGPEVLPPAEIHFLDYPEGKPHIVGYASKWDPSSFEYRNTPRTFKFDNKDKPLLKELEKISLRCWEKFEMKGYVRVDFRVDASGHTYVLEINANPCLSPDAGFIAACRMAGMDYPEVIDRIIFDAFR